MYKSILLMKKRVLRELLKNRRINYIGDYDESAQSLKTLELAWSNLPDDLTDDERYLFIELVGDVIKLHNRIEISNSSSDMEKN